MQIGSKESTLGLYFGASSKAIIAYVPEKVIGYLDVNTESVESVTIKSQSIPKFMTSGKSIKSVSKDISVSVLFLFTIPIVTVLSRFIIPQALTFLSEISISSTLEFLLKNLMRSICP